MDKVEDGLLGDESAIVARAAPGRRAEFRAGRAAARQALMGLSIAPTPILSRTGGDPVWPAGVVGSITHTKAWAIAAVAPVELLSGLGVDLEEDTALDADVADYVCRVEERMVDPALISLGIDAAKLRFVAKEAWYKAVYPDWRRFIGFDECVVAIDADRGRFHARFVGERRSDRVSGPPGASGHFLHLSGLLCAVCPLPPSPEASLAARTVSAKSAG